MPETKMVETGKFELTVKIPYLMWGNAKYIMRDLKRVLEKCGRLDLLDEFTETLMVEYREEAN